MGITHVIRGDDHLSNTPRQIVVFEALEAAVPTFAHMSLIFGADGKRLSKRHGATSVESYRDMGYLPAALLNYLAGLGFSIDGETTIFSRETLIEHFDLTRVSKSPGVWDPEKLDWMNGTYIRDMSADDFVDAMAPWLVAAGLTTADSIADNRSWYRELAPLISERTKRFDEVAEKVAFLFVEPTIDESAREKVLAKEGAGRVLDAAIDALSKLTTFDLTAVEEALRALPDTLEMKPKMVFQPLRVAVTGTTVSPPLFESLALLGRERTLARLRLARPLCAD
jgi:glutamyl-tRNA synthetase